MRAAQVMGVSLDFLISDGEVAEACYASIDGFIEVNGQTYRIRSKEDIEKVLKLL